MKFAIIAVLLILYILYRRAARARTPEGRMPKRPRAGPKLGGPWRGSR
jgi:hypothetical protein